jgi:hypothetical protein
MQGELYLARRSRPVTRPALLPAELQEVIDHPLAGVRAGAAGELARLLQGRHAGQALAARMALERLANDDSRAVAAAAAAALAAVESDSGSVAPGGFVPAQREPPAARDQAPPAVAATTSAHPTPAPEAAGAGRVGRGRWIAAGLARVGRGRWVAAGLAIAVVATIATLAIVRPWAAGCGFSDEFNGDAVDSRWERVNNSADAAVVKGGSLELSVPDGADINETYQTAPGLLQVLTGDFTLETEVDTEPWQLFQSAGLLLWNGPGTYVRLERGFGDVHAVLLEYRDNGGPHMRPHPPLKSGPNVIRTDATRVLLQLTKTDSQVSARWRPFEDSRWRSLGKIDIQLPNSVKAGVAVLNHAQEGAQPASFSGQFNYVRATCA